MAPWDAGYTAWKSAPVLVFDKSQKLAVAGEPVINVSRRTQWWMIGIGYAATVAWSAMMILSRYMLYVLHPQEAAAAGGMYAFGDEILAYFIFFLLMVPTFFLLRRLADNELTYNKYSWFVLALGLTAPLSLAWIYASDAIKTQVLQGTALMRLFQAPMFLIFIATSRWSAQSKLSKRLTSWGLISEAATFALSIALLVVSARR